MELKTVDNNLLFVFNQTHTKNYKFNVDRVKVKLFKKYFFYLWNHVKEREERWSEIKRDQKIKKYFRKDGKDDTMY